MEGGGKILTFLMLLSITGVALCVKEWKNYENGEVHSHKKQSYKRPAKSSHEDVNEKDEKHFLHGHHGDKSGYHQVKPVLNHLTSAAYQKSELQNTKKQTGKERHQNKWKDDLETRSKNGMHKKHTFSRMEKNALPEMLNDESSQYSTVNGKKHKREKQVALKEYGEKKSKKKGTEEKKHSAKYNHSLLRSITPKHNKSKNIKKNHTKTNKVHAYANAKAREILKKLPHIQNQVKEKGGKKIRFTSTSTPELW